MMRRREFLATAAMAGGVMAVGCAPGGRALPGDAVSGRVPAKGATRDTACNRVPYGETIGDRLWMWGHHRDSFKALKSSKEQYNLPFDTRIDMAPACAAMNIPGCFIVRWTNNPTTAELPAYMKQFAQTKRVGFSITDSAVDTFEEKVRLGFEYAERMPNLTTLIMDDFWSVKDFTRSLDELRPLRERMHAKKLRLGIVMYADKDKKVAPEYKPVLDLCDEITLWFWSGKNLGQIAERVGQLRNLVGDEKAVLLGQYMWDFGGCQPLSGAQMAAQLGAAEKLLDTRAVDGLIFHCTPLVDMDLDAVRVSKEWIAANGSRPWGRG